jgi:hypothetical protein
MTLFEFTAAHEAPHEFIEECLANKQGKDEYETMLDLYNEISFWEALHPDDDFEKIVDKMVDFLTSEYA